MHVPKKHLKQMKSTIDKIIYRLPWIQNICQIFEKNMN